MVLLNSLVSKPDLDSKENIALFVDAFYQRLLQDKQLSAIFLNTANIDLSLHLPIICRYWQKLLLGDNTYNRHTINIHRALNQKYRLNKSDFDRWLCVFTCTVDEYFSGAKAERAKLLANRIANNMLHALVKD